MYRAIVAEVHPIHQPPKTGKILRSLSSFSRLARTVKMTAQTMAQPKL
jgi:hypothetical protein